MNQNGRYGLREQSRPNVSGSATGYVASNHAQNFRDKVVFTKTGGRFNPRSADQPRAAGRAAPGRLGLWRGC